MKLSLTNAKKFLRILTKTKKKYFTCEDMSRATGLKVDVVIDYVAEFYEMIQLDTSYDLKQLIPALEKYIATEEKIPTKKVKKISHKEYSEYSSFMDYINKNMTSGGILDTGYKLTLKDKKILRHLLDKKK